MSQEELFLMSRVIEWRNVETNKQEQMDTHVGQINHTVALFYMALIQIKYHQK